MAELLRAEGIRKHYGGVSALRGAALSVAAGEVHALVGENGAGKSTLAKIIAGSVRPDAGAIAIDGRAAAIRNPREAQKLGIGMIYQELDLFPNLTIAENIVIGNLRFADSGPRAVAQDGLVLPPLSRPRGPSPDLSRDGWRALHRGGATGRPGAGVEHARAPGPDG